MYYLWVDSRFMNDPDALTTIFFHEGVEMEMMLRRRNGLNKIYDMLYGYSKCLDEADSHKLAARRLRVGNIIADRFGELSNAHQTAVNIMHRYGLSAELYNLMPGA